MSGNDSYVSLLLHLDGTNGSTSFPDASSNNVSVSPVGSAHVDTSESVFGGASLNLNGTTDNLTWTYGTNFDVAAGDFTIDCRIRFNSTAGAQTIYCARDSLTGGQKDAVAFYVSGGTVRFQGIVNTISQGDYQCSWTPSINTWYHIAIVRNGANFYIFINGVSQTLTVNTAISTNSLSPTYGTPIPAIGEYGDYNGFYFNGWIDEFRFSKGIARWTTNFTPPTAAYDNNDNVSVIGVSATGSLGSITPVLSPTISGVSATGAIGSAAISGAANVSATGVSATGSIGTVTTNIAPRFSGISATGSIGTVSVTGAANVAPVGVAGTGHIGSVTSDIIPIMRGISASGAIGTVTTAAGADVSASGILGTGSIGSGTIVVAPAIAGIYATGAIGTPTAEDTINVTGVQAIGSIGTVTPQISPSITGVAGTGHVGSPMVAGDANVAVSGVSATGAVGAVVIGITVFPAGVSASGHIGTVSVSAGGNVTVLVTGIEASGAVGSIAPQVAPAVSGVSGAGAIGVANTAVDLVALGVIGTGAVGLIVPGVTVTVNGAEGTGEVGMVTFPASTSKNAFTHFWGHGQRKHNDFAKRKQFGTVDYSTQ